MISGSVFRERKRLILLLFQDSISNTFTSVYKRETLCTNEYNKTKLSTAMVKNNSITLYLLLNYDITVYDDVLLHPELIFFLVYDVIVPDDVIP